MISSTSRMAFEKIKEQLSDRRGQVFAAVWSSAEPVSDFQIAKALHWPINCVTPRRSELEQMGYIELAYIAPGEPSNMEVNYWVVAPKAMEEGFEPRPLLKYERKARMESRPITVHEAARVMAEWRTMKRKQRKAAVETPLFG